MNATERVKMVKAMELIARNINDEEIFCNRWLAAGVADGDIDYGDMSADDAAIEEMEYYIEDEEFSDIMALFLRCMAAAKKSGGLYCDGVVSKEWNA